MESLVEYWLHSTLQFSNSAVHAQLRGNSVKQMVPIYHLNDGLRPSPSLSATVLANISQETRVGWTSTHSTSCITLNTFTRIFSGPYLFVSRKRHLSCCQQLISALVFGFHHLPFLQGSGNTTDLLSYLYLPPPPWFFALRVQTGSDASHLKKTLYSPFQLSLDTASPSQPNFLQSVVYTHCPHFSFPAHWVFPLSSLITPGNGLYLAFKLLS